MLAGKPRLNHAAQTDVAKLLTKCYPAKDFEAQKQLIPNKSVDKIVNTTITVTQTGVGFLKSLELRNSWQ